MITPLDVLRRARGLISKREAWTQRALARDKYCVTICYDSEFACSFCSAGAIWRAGLDLAPDGFKATEGAFAEIDAVLETGNQALIARFNDNATHSEVLAVFDRAIGRLSRTCGI